MATATAIPLRQSRIDLEKSIREKSIQILQPILYSCIDLKTQIKQAHWNVRGIQFIGIHELFDTLAGEIEATTDDVAERITALGGLAFGNIRDGAKESCLGSIAPDATGVKELIAGIADRYSEMGAKVRKAIDETEEAGDADTADLLTGFSRNLDLRLWFLEAHIEQ